MKSLQKGGKRSKKAEKKIGQKNWWNGNQMADWIGYRWSNRSIGRALVKTNVTTTVCSIVMDDILSLDTDKIGWKIDRATRSTLSPDPQIKSLLLRLSSAFCWKCKTWPLPARNHIAVSILLLELLDLASSVWPSKSIYFPLRLFSCVRLNIFDHMAVSVNRWNSLSQ